MPAPVISVRASRLFSRGGEKGFSLVEMLVALIILSVSILALTSVTITAIKTNSKNELRNAVVRLTKETVEDVLAQSYSSLSSGSSTKTQTLRGVSKSFDVQWAVSETTPNLKRVTITVETNHAGDTISNMTVFYKHSTQ